jgi:hypothetical protein
VAFPGEWVKAPQDGDANESAIEYGFVYPAFQSKARCALFG